MPRRIQKDDAADLDVNQRRRRFRQISLRLRMCFEQGSAQYERVQSEVAALGGDSPDLDGLLDLCNELRPLLPEAVRVNTLPESFNDWRTTT